MNELVITIPVLVIWLLVGVSLIGRQQQEEQRWLWYSLLAHLASAFGIVLVTEFYYGGGDMFGYAHVGRFLADKLRADFLGFAPDLLNMVFQLDRPFPVPGPQMGSNTGSMQALSAFIMLFCGDSLYAACVMIAGVNFLTKFGLYRSLRLQLPELPVRTLAVPCLLVPSAVFWSSGLLKESIAVIGLGMLIYGGTLMAMASRAGLGLLLVSAGATLVFLVKGYLLPPFGIGVGLWFLARAVLKQNENVLLRTRSLVLGTVIAVGLVVVTGAYLPQFSAETFADEARAAQAVGARMNAGSNYTLGTGSMVSQLPLGVVTVFFRPALFEVNSVMILLSALEMTWLTVLAVRALFRRSITLNLREVLKRPPLAFCLGFALTLSIGVGLTTANLGTLTRYRMPLMPFYATLLFVLAMRNDASVQTAPGFGSAFPRQPSNAA